ncbi:MAG: hypothetical protein SGPRY_014757, partial [Prymnesium sp.]
AALEESVLNLMLALLSPHSSLEGTHPSLRRMRSLLRAAQAVVGEAHWLVLALRELQIDQWLELLTTTNPEEGREGEATACLLERFEEEAGECFDR